MSAFHDTDFYLDIDSVTLGPVVGRGMFSEVHVGHYFGDLVAIKVQKRETEQLEEYLLRELSVLKNTGHENLLKYLGAYNEINSDPYNAHKLYIVTEYCHGGDLLSLLLAHQQPLSWKFRLKIATQAISALAYLHEMKLLHRDVKSSNILLDAHWDCKVSDFGMSREYGGDSAGAARMTICGTDAYMAPEMLFDEEYTCSVDVFSFGMVLLEVLKRQKVGEGGGFATRDPRKLFRLDEDEIRAMLPADAPPSFVALAMSCIKYQPPERPSAADALEWLQDLLGSTEGEMDYPPLKPVPVIVDAQAQAQALQQQAQQAQAQQYQLHLQLQMQQARASHAGRKSASGEDDLDGDEVRKTGFLYKRATNGFHNWKKVVFVLTRTALWWKSNSTGVTKGRLLLRGATLQRTIMYRFKIIQPPEQPALPGAGAGAGAAAKDDAATILNGELSAGSKAELDEWLDEIQQVVDEIAAGERQQKERQASLLLGRGGLASALAAGGVGGLGGVGAAGAAGRPTSVGLGAAGLFSGALSSAAAMLGASPPSSAAAAGYLTSATSASSASASSASALASVPEASSPSASASDLGTMLSAYSSVHDWLCALGLGQYAPNFASKGYDVPAMLDAGGLDNDDLDCLGIYTPLHRRLLKSSAGLPYSDSLLIELPRWRDFNAVICYHVVSCYKFSRSCTFKRFRDFQTLDSVLRHELRESGDALDAARLAALPALPPASALTLKTHTPLSLAGSKDVAFITARRAGLEEYLRGLQALLRGAGAHQALLLRFLDLTVSATEMDDSYGASS